MDKILFKGAFQDLLVRMPDESVDCIIADPPYGETSLPWDKWPVGWPSEIVRVLKHSGSMWVFGSTRMFLRRVAEFEHYKFAQDIVWENIMGPGFMPIDLSGCMRMLSIFIALILRGKVYTKMSNTRLMPKPEQCAARNVRLTWGTSKQAAT